MSNLIKIEVLVSPEIREMFDNALVSDPHTMDKVREYGGVEEAFAAFVAYDISATLRESGCDDYLLASIE